GGGVSACLLSFPVTIARARGLSGKVAKTVTTAAQARHQEGLEAADCLCHLRGWQTAPRRARPALTRWCPAFLTSLSAYAGPEGALTARWLLTARASTTRRRPSPGRCAGTPSPARGGRGVIAVVMGLRRSGTSLVSQILHELGVVMGEAF